MATPAAVQAALDPAENSAKIVRAIEVAGTFAEYYVLGGINHAGREKWIRTTASDSAATQAAAILTALDAS
jgi:hypothetical protein